MIKKCKICGTEFEAKSNRACYCSDKCKKEGRKAIIKKNNTKNIDKIKEWNKYNPEKRKINNHKYYLKNKENGYDYNKWNKNQIEDAKGQYHEINDGYNSSLKINYQTKKLEEAQGSKEAEKESYKYDTKSKQCKKEWAKAEKQMKPLF